MQHRGAQSGRIGFDWMDWIVSGYGAHNSALLDAIADKLVKEKKKQFHHGAAGRLKSTFQLLTLLSFAQQNTNVST